jgi:membrane fusion protein (multidrug efflux system)
MRRLPIYRRPRAVAIIVVALVVLVAAGGGYWLHSRGRESTDDAFIEGRIVRISAQVPGEIKELLVNDNQQVQANQVLVRLDDRQYRAAVDQARAELLVADAEAQRTARDSQRAEALFARQLVSAADRDHAVAAARGAAGQLESARQRLAQAQLNLSYTVITAPEAGHVTRRSAEEGAYVQVGQALMAIVPGDLWVIANFKETQLRNMQPGQRVDVKVDAYPHRVFHAHVDSIQRGTGARFSVLPPENATGNFVKVVQRVPVKIVFDDPPDVQFPLGPGMSVVPTVFVR